MIVEHTNKTHQASAIKRLHQHAIRRHQNVGSSSGRLARVGGR